LPEHEALSFVEVKNAWSFTSTSCIYFHKLSFTVIEFKRNICFSVVKNMNKIV